MANQTNEGNTGDMLTNRFHTYTLSTLKTLAKDLSETNQGYPVLQKVLAVIECRMIDPKAFQAFKASIGI